MRIFKSPTLCLQGLTAFLALHAAAEPLVSPILPRVAIHGDGDSGNGNGSSSGGSGNNNTKRDAQVSGGGGLPPGRLERPRPNFSNLLHYYPDSKKIWNIEAIYDYAYEVSNGGRYGYANKPWEAVLENVGSQIYKAAATLGAELEMFFPKEANSLTKKHFEGLQDQMHTYLTNKGRSPDEFRWTESMFQAARNGKMTENEFYERFPEVKPQPFDPTGQYRATGYQNTAPERAYPKVKTTKYTATVYDSDGKAHRVKKELNENEIRRFTEMLEDAWSTTPNGFKEGAVDKQLLSNEGGCLVEFARRVAARALQKGNSPERLKEAVEAGYQTIGEGVKMTMDEFWDAATELSDAKFYDMYHHLWNPGEGQARGLPQYNPPSQVYNTKVDLLPEFQTPPNPDDGKDDGKNDDKDDGKKDDGKNDGDTDDKTDNDDTDDKTDNDDNGNKNNGNKNDGNNNDDNTDDKTDNDDNNIDDKTDDNTDDKTGNDYNNGDKNDGKEDGKKDDSKTDDDTDNKTDNDDNGDKNDGKEDGKKDDSKTDNNTDNKTDNYDNGNKNDGKEDGKKDDSKTDNDTDNKTNNNNNNNNGDNNNSNNRPSNNPPNSMPNDPEYSLSQETHQQIIKNNQPSVQKFEAGMLSQVQPPSFPPNCILPPVSQFPGQVFRPQDVQAIRAKLKLRPIIGGNLPNGGNDPDGNLPGGNTPGANIIENAEIPESYHMKFWIPLNIGILVGVAIGVGVGIGLKEKNEKESKSKQGVMIYQNDSDKKHGSHKNHGSHNQTRAPEARKFLKELSDEPNTLLNFNFSNPQGQKVNEVATYHSFALVTRNETVDDLPDGGFKTGMKDLWGDDLALRLATSKWTMQRMMNTYKHDLGDKAWTAMSELADLIAGGNTEPDPAYRFVVFQSLLHTVQIALTYTPDREDDYFIGDLGLEDGILPQLTIALGVQKNVTNMWDKVHPDFIKSYVSAHNDIVKKRDDVAIREKIGNLVALYDAGEAGPDAMKVDLANARNSTTNTTTSLPGSTSTTAGNGTALPTISSTSSGGTNGNATTTSAGNGTTTTTFQTLTPPPGAGVFPTGNSSVNGTGQTWATTISQTFSISNGTRIVAITTFSILTPTSGAGVFPTGSNSSVNGINGPWVRPTIWTSRHGNKTTSFPTLTPTSSAGVFPTGYNNTSINGTEGTWTRPVIQTSHHDKDRTTSFPTLKVTSGAGIFPTSGNSSNGTVIWIGPTANGTWFRPSAGMSSPPSCLMGFITVTVSVTDTVLFTDTVSVTKTVLPDSLSLTKAMLFVPVPTYYSWLTKSTVVPESFNGILPPYVPLPSDYAQLTMPTRVPESFNGILPPYVLIPRDDAQLKSSTDA